MDGAGDYHTKWSKSEQERQISYDITHMWNLKYAKNEPIEKTETDSQTQWTDYGLHGWRGCGREMDWEFGVSRMQTTMCRMNKQQGPTV